MKIIIASENNERIKGVKKLLPEAEVTTVQARSYNGGTTAFNSGMILGAYNKIALGTIRDHGLSNSDWDAIIALKSGFCEKTNYEGGQKNSRYFITDVCAIMDGEGLRIANGPMFEVSRSVYEMAMKGDDIIARIGKIADRNVASSLVQYISEGVVDRSFVTHLALQNALNSKYISLNQAKLDFSSIMSFDNPSTRALEDQCKKIIYNLEEEPSSK